MREIRSVGRREARKGLSDGGKIRDDNGGGGRV